jgi:hypothetical protein
MRASGMIRSRREQFLQLLAVGVLAAVAGGGKEGGAQEGSGAAPADARPGWCVADLRMVQGRVTAIDGNLLTVKTPDGYPGGPGIHAQFVTRGPEFRVDISAGRVLEPDGRQDDRQPLAVGERVVVLFREPSAASAETTNAPLAAVMVERVSTSDRVVTH